MISGLIDAYAHCGLRKYRPIEKVRAVADRFGIARTVLVQHLGEYDNSYIGGIVAAEPDRFAGVCVIDTDAPAACGTLAREADKDVFRGIRLLAHTLGTRADLWEAAAQRGLNIIAYDEPTLAPHADLLAEFLHRHRETRMVLSHLGVLDRSIAPRFPDYDRILSLAEHPNAFLQISGMHMFAEYPYVELVPLIERALEAFGPQRLLYGSNYPLIEEDALVGRELALLLEGRMGVPLDAVEQVVRLTAHDLWFDRSHCV